MQSKSGINIVILTAGKGTRMGSNLPKILNKVAGKTIFEHVLKSVNELPKDKKNIIVITSNEIMNDFNDLMPRQSNLNYVIQEHRLGTGDAVKVAVKSKFWNKKNKYTGIFYGDVPFISKDTIDKMFNLQYFYDLVVLGFECSDHNKPYGRLFTDRDLTYGEHGQLYQIKEFKDLMREKPILCNSGVIIGKSEIFEKLLDLIKNNNKAKEYYLTDIIQLANLHKYKVGTYICEEYEVMGINSKVELEEAERNYQKRISEKHLLNGATILNRSSVYFSFDTEIGKDVVIEPNVFFGTNVKIGDNCIIKSGSYLENVSIKKNTIIEPNTIMINKESKSNKNTKIKKLKLKFKK